MKTFMYSFFLFISVFISAISQVLLKKSAQKSYKKIIFEYLNILVIVAYILFFIAVFIDLFCLKYVPLSFIPVIETSSYIFILILSRIFFNERISKLKIFSIILILSGIFVFII